MAPKAQPASAPTSVPSAASEYLLRAEKQMAAKQYAEAVASFTQAIQQSPDNPGYYLGRAVANLALRRFPAAEADATKAMQYLPSVEIVHRIRGMARIGQGNLDAAIDDLSKALSLDGRSTWARSARADAYRRTQQYAKALLDCDIALGILLQGDPQRVRVLDCRAIVYYQQKNYELAVSELSKLLADRPFGPWYYWRGMSYAAMNRCDMASRDCDELAKLTPDSTSIFVLRGAISLREKQYDQAISTYTAMIAKAPNDARGYELRAGALMRQDKPQQAMADIDEAIRRAPTSPDLHLHKAVVFARMDDLPMAIAESNRAVQLGPRWGGGYNGRGWIYLRMGMLDKALPDISKAIELNPRDGYYDSRAWIYFYMGEYDKAQADRAKADNQNYEWLLAFDFRLACAKGNAAAAVAGALAALKTLPEDSEMRSLLGYYLGRISRAELRATCPNSWSNFDVATRGFGPREVEAIKAVRLPDRRPHPSATSMSSDSL